jgi:hypothetical protein
LAEVLRVQAGHCERLGSHLYADLLSRAATDVEAGGPVWELLRDHADDPPGTVLGLRLMGAVHRLALEGRLPELADAYGRPDADPAEVWALFARALSERVEELRPLLERTVQTNEVGRCAALLLGFLAVSERAGLPLRLLEVGSSAGLNLRWDRYRYEADGFAWGPADSPLRLRFELRGGSPPAPTPLTVAERRGCDPSPLDPTAEEGRLTLLSYLWPDQRHRVERMLAATAIAAETPAEVERVGARTPWRTVPGPRHGRLPLDRHAVPGGGGAAGVRSDDEGGSGAGDRVLAARLATDGARQRPCRGPADALAGRKGDAPRKLGIPRRLGRALTKFKLTLT